MRHKFAFRAANAAIAVAALALTLNTPAIGSPIALGVFGEFGFTTVGTPATGCDPADPAGPFCIPSSGTPTIFLGAPPWTFVAPTGGAILTVTDAFVAGDRFQIFDFGASIGLTSVPSGTANCGSDPVVCLNTPGISSGTFLLAAGNHSLTLTATLSPMNGGAGYLRADAAVPEPVSWTLFAAGLATFALRPKVRNRKLLIRAACFGVGPIATAVWFGQGQVLAQAVTRFSGPNSSQPLALPADDSFLAVVNPDNNSVSFFDVTGDSKRRIGEVPVQTEPNGVAVLPDGSKAYVANTVSGTVSVIPLNISNGFVSKPSKQIPVGTEPYGLALTPNGTKRYVSNSRSDSVSVIDTATGSRPACPLPALWPISFRSARSCITLR
jgi:YVTN family beta-propeller protein